MVAAPPQDTVHLAIETTGRNGSIAILRGEQVLRQLKLDPKLRTAASLAPQIDKTLANCRDQGNPVTLISVADGPGSFTGLRIGVTTAKTLCYALDLPLVAVDSLAAIAATGFHSDLSASSICVGVDAYRGQVFAGVFRRKDLLPQLSETPQNWSAHPEGVSVLSAEHWQMRLQQLPQEIRLAGDERPFGSKADRRMERCCDAVGVGLLAIRAFQRAQVIDPLGLVPRYLKASAAEEKL